jgi:hypothetical protein
LLEALLKHPLAAGPFPSQFFDCANPIDVDEQMSVAEVRIAA